VPGHADEEAAVVAEVRGPPVFRIGHDRREILDDGVEVEALEFLDVIEVRVRRIRERVVLVQHREIELLRPPVAI
jgi:hypothetical protein